MDQWEHSAVGSTPGTVAGQLSPHPKTDDTLSVMFSLFYILLQLNSGFVFHLLYFVCFK